MNKLPYKNFLESYTVKPGKNFEIGNWGTEDINDLLYLLVAKLGLSFRMQTLL